MNQINFNLMSSRDLTYKRKITREEIKVIKEESIRRFVATEETLKEIGLHHEFIYSNSFPPRILYGNNPSRYINAEEIKDLIREGTSLEELLGETKEIGYWGKNCNPQWVFSFQNKNIWHFIGDSRTLEEYGKGLYVANLLVTPEAGKRGWRFFAFNDYTIPFDILRVEVEISENLASEFEERYKLKL